MAGGTLRVDDDLHLPGPRRRKANAEHYASKHPDLATFHTARYRAMAAAFGVSDPPSPPAGHQLAHLFGEVEGWTTPASPFSSYLEAPPEIIRLHQKYGRTIHEHLDALNAAVRELRAELTEQIFGRDATITDEDLRAQEFDPTTLWPDELDYF